MSRNSQQPTRRDGGPHDEYIEEHPAYAMIGASRVSANPGVALFGSDFLHQHYVVVRIGSASMGRGLSHDWYHGRMTEYAEIAMSEAQWASFVSSMNVGSGIPATLQRLNGETIPAIEPITDRREQLRGDIKANLDTAMQAIRDAMDAVDASSLSGKGKKELRNRLDLALRELGPNLDFVAQSFDDHAEQTVEKAKTEVNAYLTAAIQRAGLQALGGTLPVLELSKGDDDDVRTGE